MKLVNSFIAGVNPLSLNDYPKEMSYVIFLGGCNFKCPYCHNSSVVYSKTEELKLENVINDLNERRKFIKVVVITGGEPTIHGKELINLIKIIKNMGFKVKLDTNGTNPKLIKEIISLNLIDYIAMDIKNTFRKYDETAGTKVYISNIKKCINLIEESNIDYEFRTTINKTMHSIKDIQEIKSYIKNPKKYFLQNYNYNKEQITNINFIKFSNMELEDIKNSLKVKIKL